MQINLKTLLVGGFALLALFTTPFLASAQSVSSAVESPIKEAPKRTILIPTAFSPNGDGVNDIFKLVNVTDEELIDFSVFNRWGTVLFETKDITRGWDGTYKNQNAEFGVYGYAIKIKYSDGVEEVYRGTVMLVR